MVLGVQTAKCEPGKIMNNFGLHIDVYMEEGI